MLFSLRFSEVTRCFVFKSVFGIIDIEGEQKDTIPLRGGKLTHNQTVSNTVRIYYLDPDVLLQAPRATFSFDEHLVVMPSTAFEELGKFAGQHTEKGENAQKALRLLEQNVLSQEAAPMSSFDMLMQEFGQNVCHGQNVLPLGERGFLLLDRQKSDKGIVACVEQFYGSYIRGNKTEFCFVSQNVAARTHALSLGIKAEIYRGGQPKDEEEYTGRREILLSRAEISQLYADGTLDGMTYLGMSHNEYAIVKSSEGGSESALVRYDARIGCLRKVTHFQSVYGINARNAGQHFALDALMMSADECPLVIIQGGAGTAKTFLSLAAGLEQVVSTDPKYRRILVTRPNAKFDDTLGFLKGGEKDKLAPLLRPIMDNLDQLTTVKTDKQDYRPPKRGSRRPMAWEEEAQDKLVAPNSYAQELFDNGKIVGEAMEYMRGRTICNTYVLVDEAQNIPAEKVATMISRAGKGTKIILEGDPEQVDNPSLTAKNNGLAWASQRMKGSLLCAQVTFEPSECERSPLAEEMIKRMSPKDM